MKLRSSEPFWLVKNGLLNSYPSLQENAECDVLIIGSGITGALVAYRCAKDGYSTIVADRRETATGSTSATTAMLQYEIDLMLCDLIPKIGEEGAVASYRACSEAIDKVGHLHAEINSEAGFRKKDSLYFASRRRHLKHLREEYEARAAHGFPVEWLDAEEISERYGLQNSFGGILSHQGASIDGFRFAHDLLSAAVERGLRIFDKTEFQNISHNEDAITAISTEGFEIKAKKIIYCTGFETVEILKENFVDLLSTYAIVGEQQSENCDGLKDTLFWNTGDPYEYFRTTDDGRILIGGLDDDFSNAKRRDAKLEKKSRRLEKYIHKNLPGYQFRTDFAWAGTFGSTKDGLPYIGEHKDFPNGYFVLGFGGNGITFSVAGAYMVSDYLRGKEHPLSQWFKFGR